MNAFVLDTSALIALKRGEDGAEKVASILRAAQKKKSRAAASFISLTEMFYVFWQKAGKEEAYKTHLQLKMLPLEFCYPDEKILTVAGEIKARFPVSLADALVAALAKQSGATLVHKDPEFEHLSGLIRHHALPYKKGRP
jgi:predicted nucleic acid-binding protein